MGINEHLIVKNWYNN